MALARVFVCALAVLAAASGASAAAQSQKVTPVEKVITLLKNLQAEVEAEGKKEAKQYDDYSCFCKEQADNKLYAIEKSTAKNKKLTAEINALDAEISELNQKISDLAIQIAELEKAIAEAVATRKEEHGAYLVEAEDMRGAQHALEGAIKALKDSKSDQSNAKLDLVQMQALAGRVLAAIQRSPSVHATDAQVKAVTGFLQMTQEPASYTFHSNDILATLEGLLTEFKQNKKDLDIAEFETKAQFDKNKLNLEHEKQFAEKDKKEKETLSTEKDAINTEKKADREQETKDKNSDQAFMDVLTADCEKKAEQFDQRSKMRADELTAMGNAMGELESGVQPNYSANKKLVGLQRATRGVGTLRTVSLLQRSSTSAHEATPRKVVAFLVAASERLNSPLLSSIALKAQVKIDHFVEVRGIIKDLMAKLEADAAAEAETKSFCDKEMKRAVEKRDEQIGELEKLASQTSVAEAEKSRQEDAIQDLADAIAALQKALKEATDLRLEEKAENEKALAEASAGEEAVKNAMGFLSDFYKNAALVQSGYVPPNSDRDGNTVGDLAPEVFDDTYHGKQEASKGIIGMLEVIASDFERTTETVADAEKAAQEAFEQYETTTTEDIEGKGKEKKERETRVAELNEELTKLKEQTMDAKATLAEVLSELGTLKEMCVDGTETYEERVAKRKKEIEALKQAYKLLDDWQGDGVVKPAA